MSELWFQGDHVRTPDGLGNICGVDKHSGGMWVWFATRTGTIYREYPLTVLIEPTNGEIEAAYDRELEQRELAHEEQLRALPNANEIFG